MVLIVMGEDKNMLFRPYQCISDGRDNLCATDTVPVTSRQEISLVKCSALCGTLNGCVWFNFFRSNGNLGTCQLYNGVPRNFSSVTGCRLYKVNNFTLHSYTKANK